MKILKTEHLKIILRKDNDSKQKHLTLNVETENRIGKWHTEYK